jgi:riboflavin kinase/FMN adenylyltransferase
MGGSFVTLKKVVLTIGVFDGFHRGHQVLVRATVRLARRWNARPAALTFANHPLNVLHREGKVPFLYPRRETFRALRSAGIERLWAVDFTRRYARQSPGEFVRRLVRRIGLKAVVVGRNFRFGAGNRGDVAVLERLGRKHGFKVVAVGLKGGARDTVSSSRIRHALAEGRMEEANRMLGRPFHITGRVGRGRRIGHELGYPTANLTRLGCFLPKEGIYACSVEAGGRLFRGAMDLGSQPTIPNGRPKVRAEVHLIGFKGGLCGKRITIRLLRYIRPEVKFKSRESLIRRIQKDVFLVRRMKIPLK